jgi:hypothetical protein
MGSFHVEENSSLTLQVPVFVAKVIFKLYTDTHSLWVIVAFVIQGFTLWAVLNSGKFLKCIDFSLTSVFPCNVTASCPWERPRSVKSWWMSSHFHPREQSGSHAMINIKEFYAPIVFLPSTCDLWPIVQISTLPLSSCPKLTSISSVWGLWSQAWPPCLHTWMLLLLNI